MIPVVMNISNVEFAKTTDLKFSKNLQKKLVDEREYASLMEKVRMTGMTKPLLVERITNKVLSGNLLLLIALELGLSYIPVVYTDLRSNLNRVLRPVA
jgi:ParB-like chromosome segregation protein Spo0J